MQTMKCFTLALNTTTHTSFLNRNNICNWQYRLFWFPLYALFIGLLSSMTVHLDHVTIPLPRFDVHRQHSLMERQIFFLTIIIINAALYCCITAPSGDHRKSIYPCVVKPPDGLLTAGVAIVWCYLLAALAGVRRAHNRWPSHCKRVLCRRTQGAGGAAHLNMPWPRN